MIKHFVIFSMSIVLVTGSVALAATETPGDYEKSGARTALQSTTADRPPAAICPRPTHRKRTAKLRRPRWTQATAIGILRRSPLQPRSVSSAVARKREQKAPADVGSPQLQV